jgi:hypothetical protein
MMAHAAPRAQVDLEERACVTRLKLLKPVRVWCMRRNYRDAFRVDTTAMQQQCVTYA